MKTATIKDERVAIEQRKIVGEAFSLVMVFLLGSLLVKQFYFGATFRECAIEYIAFFGGCFYLVVRNLLLGYNVIDERRVKTPAVPVLQVVVVAISVMLSSTFLNRESFQSTGDLLVTMLISFCTSALTAMLFYFMVYKLSKKRSATLEKKFDEDDLEN